MVIEVNQIAANRFAVKGQLYYNTQQQLKTLSMRTKCTIAFYGTEDEFRFNAVLLGSTTTAQLLAAANKI